MSGGIIQGHSLTQLFQRGCIEIGTPDPEDERRLLLRTLIQMDADVVHFVDPKVYGRHQLIEKHMARCRKPARSLQRIRLTLNNAHWLSGLPLGYAAWHGAHLNHGQLAVGLTMALPLLLLKTAARAWLTRKLSDSPDRLDGP